MRINNEQREVSSEKWGISSEQMMAYGFGTFSGVFLFLFSFVCLLAWLAGSSSHISKMMTNGNGNQKWQKRMKKLVQRRNTRRMFNP